LAQNYVVQPNQEITLTQDEMNKLYAALGVEIKKSENQENIDPNPISPSDTTGVTNPTDTTGIIPPIDTTVVTNPADTTTVGCTHIDEGNGDSDKKNGNAWKWILGGVGTALLVGAAIYLAKSGKGKEAINKVKDLFKKKSNPAIGEAKSRIAQEKDIARARKMQDEIADLMLNPSKKSAKESAAVFEANEKELDRILIEINNKKNKEVSSVLNSIEHNHTGATTQEIREAVAKAEAEAERLKNLKEGLYDYVRNGNHYVIEVGKNGKVSGILTATKDGYGEARYLTEAQIAKFLDKNPDAIKQAIAA